MIYRRREILNLFNNSFIAIKVMSGQQLDCFAFSDHNRMCTKCYAKKPCDNLSYVMFANSIDGRYSLKQININ